jgi:hypothetical protein
VRALAARRLYDLRRRDGGRDARRVSVTEPQDEQQVAYRSRAVWFWPVAWPVALALRWLLGWDAGGPLVLWIPGIALLEANAVLTALRAGRGLTLTARGII